MKESISPQPYLRLQPITFALVAPRARLTDFNQSVSPVTVTRWLTAGLLWCCGWIHILARFESVHFCKWCFSSLLFTQLQSLTTNPKIFTFLARDTSLMIQRNDQSGTSTAVNIPTSWCLWRYSNFVKLLYFDIDLLLHFGCVQRTVQC